MDISGALELLRRDVEDSTSDLHEIVMDGTNVSEEEFLSTMEKNIEWASRVRLDECDGDLYAAYTFVDDRQVYFKFLACDDEMEDALGNFTIFLDLYRGGISLSDLGTAVLADRALPFYYLEFGVFSKELSEEPAVRKWGGFGVSRD